MTFLDFIHYEEYVLVCILCGRSKGSGQPAYYECIQDKVVKHPLFYDWYRNIDARKIYARKIYVIVMDLLDQQFEREILDT